MKLNVKFTELEKANHYRIGFDCGEKELNLFLKTQAYKYMQVGISKTMVLPDNTSNIDGKHPVCAFYTIAPGSIKRATLPQSLAKKLPYYPVPVFLIAQMAIDIKYQRKGFGKITLIKALEYLWKVNDQMAAYAIIIDCLNEGVSEFYKKYGFEVLCEHNSKLRMFMPMKVVENLFKN